MATITTTTVRDATFDVLRERGLTTLFANPGSTEIQLLSGLPDRTLPERRQHPPADIA